MPHADHKPSTRRRAANIKRILEAAMQIVGEGGFAGLSMNKLADACDYTPGALYRYFASKDMLLSALVGQILEQLREALDDAVGRAPADAPLVRLWAITTAYRQFARTQPHEFGLIALSFAEPQLLLTTPESAEPIVNQMIQTMTPLAESLTRAASEGLLAEGDVVERALLVFTSTQGVLQMHKQARIAPNVIDVDRLATAALRTLLIGWGADPERVDLAHERARALVVSLGDLS
ncbi:MAG: TetR/AcrR family transcriptional regulator [Sandaracinaceae bacterium]|nr:TetR/AcrR family transcriptional regulator [Sandaracinaceae bacterium]